VALGTDLAIQGQRFVETRARAPAAQRRQARPLLAVATYDALEQAGITIPFPQRDLHLQSVSPAARSALARDGSEGGER
jgi:small-conductance mechanosensitive channel